MGILFAKYIHKGIMKNQCQGDHFLIFYFKKYEFYGIFLFYLKQTILPLFWWPEGSGKPNLGQVCSVSLCSARINGAHRVGQLSWLWRHTVKVMEAVPPWGLCHLLLLLVSIYFQLLCGVFFEIYFINYAIIVVPFLPLLFLSVLHPPSHHIPCP